MSNQGERTMTATEKTENLTIRIANHADRDGLTRLAQLDSQLPPSSARTTLVAELDGELVAALPLGAPAIADPFRRTAVLVDLLQTRAAEIAACERPSRRRRLGSLRLSHAARA